MKIKNLVLTLFIALAGLPAFAQMMDPVNWSFSSSEGTKEGEVIIEITADIDAGWHVYSQFIGEGGPVPTSFTFEPSGDFELIGKVKEDEDIIEGFDKTFQMDIAWFDDQATFSQVVKLNKESANVKGVLEYMVCNDMQCLPPTEVEFDIPVKTVLPAKAKPEAPVKKEEPKKEEAKADKKPAASEKTAEISPEKKEAVEVAPVTESTEMAKAEPKIAEETTDVAPVAEEGNGSVVVEASLSEEAETTNKNKSLWAIFFAGLLGGFAAILMPCIFPMLPLTVSFFTKGAESRGKAIGKSLFYGISIIVIYVALGLIITIIFGADTMNSLSTNGIFNFLFFILLVVFAASFLGAFELSLPSSWTNKVDAKADKGGLLGIFFMAFALALVSFSCTGPIIGTLLVQAASMGELMGPAVGMIGFSLALALPFTLFSLFPGWMQSLPKSGGWLNSVKVVLGLLELALAFKFLSNVDLAYHWEWFDRELFLSLWIIIFGIMGFYLLGKIRFPHDSELKSVTPMRAFLAIGVLAFTIYMVPGLWGAPLKSIAAFLPPQHTQDFDLYTASLSNSGGIVRQASTVKEERKYSDLFHAPLNLDPFFDYEEGIAHAKKVGKPVMIDFTGHACVNCRKMEATVWPDPQVLSLIREEYVLIQLYVDDKTELPEEEHYVSGFSGKKITTIGKKWSDVQASMFRANSQPYYVLMDPSEEVLLPPQGADYDVDNFREYLESGLDKFNKI